MKKTVFYEQHLSAGAKMVEFAGWAMPLEYGGGIAAEHLWCRRGCALFDTSHMSVLEISGPGSADALGRVLAADPAGLATGRCRYTFMLNERGGVVDDLVLYALGTDRFRLVANASTREKVSARLEEALPARAVRDLAGETAKIDLQGPHSPAVITETLGLPASRLAFFRFDFFPSEKSPVLVSRTGYTGETGFEIYLDRAAAPDAWSRLLADPRVRPAGIGARDTLRLEMGLPLYGHEIDEEITPLEAGLGRFVGRDHDYLGKDALFSGPPARRAAALLALGRRAPRAGHLVFEAGKPVGRVTSGSFSPSLEVGVGLALIDNALLPENPDTVSVGRREPEIECRLTDRETLAGMVRRREG